MQRLTVLENASQTMPQLGCENCPDGIRTLPVKAGKGKLSPAFGQQLTRCNDSSSGHDLVSKQRRNHCGIFNSMTRKKEPFIPIYRGKVAFMLAGLPYITIFILATRDLLLFLTFCAGIWSTAGMR